MPSAQIYMEHPETAELVHLGKLTLNNNQLGEFIYSSTALEANVWVPDPFCYPLSDQVYTVTKNQGIPGFIDDAMPDGWGERLLQRMQHDPLSKFELLIRSTNTDRAGNLLVGRDMQPPVDEGKTNLPHLLNLNEFIDACEIVYDRDADEDALQELKHQLSSLGGARPKRTFLSEKKQLIAKPHDRFDQYNVASLEHACMTFAANKGMRVASTNLYRGQRATTLLVERFDRQYSNGVFRRIPMLSGLTLLDTEWNIVDPNARSYSRLADQMHCRSVPDQDRRELYMRMVYNALIGNADDHPRNHAIIYTGGSWRLSPMYDALPLIDEGPAKHLSMSVGIDGAKLSRANLLSKHQHFSLTKDEAEGTLELVASWVEELRDYYGEFLQGEELDLAREATCNWRLLA